MTTDEALKTFAEVAKQYGWTPEQIRGVIRQAKGISSPPSEGQNVTGESDLGPEERESNDGGFSGPSFVRCTPDEYRYQFMIRHHAGRGHARG